MASASQPSWWRSILPLLAISAAVTPAVASQPHNVFVATNLVIPQVVHSSYLPAATLLRDDRIPINHNGQWSFMQQATADEIADELRLRAAETKAETETETETASDSTATTTEEEDATTKTTAEKRSATVTTTKTSTSALPSVFDGNLAANFSSGTSCSSFISNFLADSTFKKCYPFSMLLQGSRSMFNAEKSLVSITQVLDATCAANVTMCTSYFKELATNLTSTSTCGVDYKLGNSVIVQAYQGMMAYQPLYTASCLQDTQTNAYCFGNAITNNTTPANAYFYYLPLNNSLPSTSTPSCNRCLQLTMGVYRSATADRTASIASTYLGAAQRVNTVCGASFVNETLPAAAVSGSVSMKSPSMAWLLPTILLSVVAQLLF